MENFSLRLEMYIHKKMRKILLKILHAQHLCFHIAHKNDEKKMKNSLYLSSQEIYLNSNIFVLAKAISKIVISFERISVPRERDQRAAKENRSGVGELRAALKLAYGNKK